MSKKQTNVSDQPRDEAPDLDRFDYAAPAELFVARGRASRSNVTYRRFNTAAEALRFAMEELDEAALSRACLELEEARFGSNEIRTLYASAAYPLTRPVAMT
jgi:hypothetical protein